jgi:hypothetical protein
MSLSETFVAIAPLTHEELIAQSRDWLIALGYTIRASSETDLDWLIATPPEDHPHRAIALVAHCDIAAKAPPPADKIQNIHGIVTSPGFILGADDRAGVAAILELLNHDYRPTVILTTGEEKGCIGAKKLVATLKDPPAGLRLMIEIDRASDNGFVHYGCTSKIRDAYVTRFGFESEGRGTSTDIAEIMPAWKISGANLAAGYKGQHGTSERLSLPILQHTMDRVAAMICDPPDAPIVFDGYVYTPAIRNGYDHSGYNQSMYGMGRTQPHNSLISRWSQQYNGWYRMVEGLQVFDDPTIDAKYRADLKTQATAIKTNTLTRWEEQQLKLIECDSPVQIEEIWKHCKRDRSAFQDCLMQMANLFRELQHRRPIVYDQPFLSRFPKCYQREYWQEAAIQCDLATANHIKPLVIRTAQGVNAVDKCPQPGELSKYERKTIKSLGLDPCKAGDIETLWKCSSATARKQFRVWLASERALRKEAEKKTIRQVNVTVKPENDSEVIGLAELDYIPDPKPETHADPLWTQDDIAGLEGF